MRRNKYRPKREDLEGGNRGKSCVCPPLEIDWAQLVRIRKLSVINYSAICDGNAKSNFDALFGFYLLESVGAFPPFGQSDPPVEIIFQLARFILYFLKNCCAGVTHMDYVDRKIAKNDKEKTLNYWSNVKGEILNKKHVI
jgi:hypothetical protein